MTDYHIRNKDTQLYYRMGSRHGVDNPNAASRFYSKKDAEKHLSEREEIVEHWQAFNDFITKTYKWAKNLPESNHTNSGIAVAVNSLEETKRQANKVSRTLTEMLSNPYPTDSEGQVFYNDLILNYVSQLVGLTDLLVNSNQTII